MTTPAKPPAPYGHVQARGREASLPSSYTTRGDTTSVCIGIEGDALSLDADTAPPSAMLDLLARRKAQVIALLRLGGDGWSGADWWAFFDERAGIAEFNGGWPRDQAEARTFACCVAEWLNRNPMQSAQHLAAAVTMARPNMAQTHCYRSERKLLGMFGCIRVAGLNGKPAGKPKLSPCFRLSRSERRGHRHDH